MLRKILKKEDPLRYKEKLFSSCFNIKKIENKKLIWFHAVSVGEFKSILPLIKKLNLDNNNLEFLITTVTLSSGKLAEVELKKFNNVLHRYFPLDVSFLVKDFLLQWRPSYIFLVDSEIWPNLISYANQLKIPLALINARLTRKSFERWEKFSSFSKYIFSKFDLCLASNLETKNYLYKLNAKNITYCGNLKLINTLEEKKIININEDYLINTKFWIAASTHENEEVFCLRTHAALKEKYNKLTTIIAPRHITRVNKIKKISESFNFKTQVLDEGDSISKDSEIVVINFFGKLHTYFKYAKSVFIGKSLVKKLKNDGGQNPIDAANLNCRIYHGPYIYNFKDIYELLRVNNISQEIKTSEELSRLLLKDFDVKSIKAKGYSNLIQNLGQKTLNDTMKVINNFLFDDFK